MSRTKFIDKARKHFLKGIGIPKKEEFVVDEFQQEAIDKVTAGEDVLVVAPTGAGKTYIAIKAMEANAAAGGRSVYTTPLKALSNTKFNEFKKLFEPQFKVGLLTGDRKIDGDADIVIATTEIYRNELYRGEGRFSLVILDEVHFIADPQRGPVWEESIILTPKSAALLMLSASISNDSEIAEWLHEVRDKECQVVKKVKRPVELRLGFLHPDLGVLPLADEEGKIFKEVSRYYGKTGLDSSGMRLKTEKKGGRRRRGGKNNRRGGKGRRGRRRK